MSALQNGVALLAAAALACLTPFTVHDAGKAAIAVVGMVLLNATLAVSLYVRAINTHGAAAVAMLFAVIPSVAGMLSWTILGQRRMWVSPSACCWVGSHAGSTPRHPVGAAGKRVRPPGQCRGSNCKKHHGEILTAWSATLRTDEKSSGRSV